MIARSDQNSCAVAYIVSPLLYHHATACWSSVPVTGIGVIEVVSSGNILEVVESSDDVVPVVVVPLVDQV